MGACGIDMQVLSLSSLTFPPIQGESDTNQAVSMAQQSNDYLAEQIRQHPDRFAGFAALPLQDPKAAADELERGDTTGLQGRAGQWAYQRRILRRAQILGGWERAEQLGVPIYLHPADSPSDQMKIYQGYPGLRSASGTGRSRPPRMPCASSIAESSTPFRGPYCCSDTWARLCRTPYGASRTGGRGLHRANSFTIRHRTMSRTMS